MLMSPKEGLGSGIWASKQGGIREEINGIGPDLMEDEIYFMGYFTGLSLRLPHEAGWDTMGD